MSLLKHLYTSLRFERQKGEFELLETEKGQPGFFAAWQEEKPRNAKADAAEERIPREIAEVEARIVREHRADINPDIIRRTFSIGGRCDALAVFVNGMADGDAINDFVLRQSMQPGVLPEDVQDAVEYTVHHIISFNETEITERWSTANTAFMDGKTAIYLEGENRAIILDTRGYEHRSISTPQNEKTIRGSQEAYTENLRTNITLLRRMLRTDDFVCEFRESGGNNSTKLAILYREGVTNAALVEEVKRKLAGIQTRVLLSTGVLEQLTETHPLSPFPQLLSTERPDRTVFYLMQGHVAVLLDGSPYANIMPTTLHSLMTSPEDSYVREPQGTVMRIVRYTGAVLSVLLPGCFLALALHHPGLLSTEVLSTLITSRRMVFAPMGAEMIFLIVVFQLIREAGLRAPGSVGQAIGIIGGLVLGQAAVAANLASTVVLIVVALSGLGNFCIPDYSTQVSVSYFRLFLVIAGWLAGLLGVTCICLVLLSWVCSLKSYGVPFLAPFAPKTYSKYPFLRRGRVKMHQKATDFTNTREGR